MDKEVEKKLKKTCDEIDRKRNNNLIVNLIEKKIGESEYRTMIVSDKDAVLNELTDGEICECVLDHIKEINQALKDAVPDDEWRKFKNGKN